MPTPNSHSHSHPPPQSSTTAIAPPPPLGPRASRLHQVFNQALARTLKANSFNNFASCFPTPARHVPASLESVWRQLNAKLEESAKAEFEEIVEEREAVAHLNELDRLVSEARERKDESGDGDQEGDAPHTLGADELYKAHLTPYLRQAQSTLDSKLEATHAQNAELAQTVQAQRLEIERLLSHIESVVADVEGAASASTQFSQENKIREEAVHMDEEVNAHPGL
ncbi:hypothetical protein N7481_000482 [Penicillium waksmanii]|uniref:uncharacterized protein n=1 Tax=Penicillium waksmanii TaxID=69791 RepID=UPI002548D4BF|nr:uncharacterized protein N7481_000482 [Penicillium waksmanii]KAJ6000073.1 hypothetical protein N7481_000482 [Penicillium waksmanii]